jgi:hypothetical protein
VNQGKKDRWGRDIWHEVTEGTWMVVHAGKLALYDDQQFRSYFDSPQLDDEDEDTMGDNVVVIQRGTPRRQNRQQPPPVRAWQSPYPTDPQGAPTGPLLPPPPPPTRNGGH